MNDEREGVSMGEDNSILILLAAIVPGVALFIAFAIARVLKGRPRKKY